MLAALQPAAMAGEYVFCTLQPDAFTALPVEAVKAMFREEEGLTVVLPRGCADERGLAYEGVFAGITLGVYSSLEAVGLTAAVAQALAARGIAANVIAAYHHDHVFVPLASREAALAVLAEMGAGSPEFLPDGDVAITGSGWRNNLYRAIPDDLPVELMQDLAAAGDVRIERIVSRGHRSPGEGWYDQDRHEWVAVLRGRATIAYPDGREIALGPGDYVSIAPHEQHRVAWTTPDADTIWLAVHY